MFCALRFEEYAAGAGYESAPSVEKERLGGVGDVEGPDRSSTAWVMVGWYSPPKDECHSLRVGRTWPRLKKVEKKLRKSAAVTLNSADWVQSDGPILEAYVVGAQAPSQVPDVGLVAERKNPPHEGVVNTVRRARTVMRREFQVVLHGDVVADGQQAAVPPLRPPAIQRGEEVVQPSNLDLVEAVQEGPRDEADAAHDGDGAEPPRQRLAHGGSWTGHGAWFCFVVSSGKTRPAASGTRNCVRLPHVKVEHQAALGLESCVWGGRLAAPRAAFATLLLAGMSFLKQPSLPLQPLPTSPRQLRHVESELSEPPDSTRRGRCPQHVAQSVSVQTPPLVARDTHPLTGLPFGRATGKRNTSRAVFTSHERALAKSNWSTSSARLNRDSFLPFGSCGLCLGIAREPVSCAHGDIFCRECALANLLTQKKELKRAEKTRRNAEQEAQRLKAADDEEDRERAVRDFEMTQAGLPTAGKKTSDANGAPQDESSTAVVHVGAKRKFQLDEDELQRIVKEDKLKARKAIEDEKAAKPTLPSFWTPSLTPDVHDSKLPNAIKKDKAVPTCPSAPNDHPHPISLHRLITVKFKEETDPSTNGERRICPSCLKTLSNSSNAIMTEQCGHVLCMSCVKKFLIPPAKKGSEQEGEVPIMCYVCDTPVTGKASKHRESGTALPPGPSYNALSPSFFMILKITPMTVVSRSSNSRPKRDGFGWLPRAFAFSDASSVGDSLGIWSLVLPQEGSPGDGDVLLLERRQDALGEAAVDEEGEARVQRQDERGRVARPQAEDAALPADISEHLAQRLVARAGARHLHARDNARDGRGAGLGARASERPHEQLLHDGGVAIAPAQVAVEAEEEEAVDDRLGHVGSQPVVQRRHAALVARDAPERVHHAVVPPLLLLLLLLFLPLPLLLVALQQMPLHLEPCRYQVKREHGRRRDGRARGPGHGVAEGIERRAGRHSGRDPRARV
ncbi:zinc finger containing protein [Purpureocillium lavendulum]|uniref:Zinc finger containing protein n=1 Tax=Purpureocillium lavendulum TaxID=1247861 RepID=A0AB34FNP3_9HYPO|nr:zinc finger containing protein [Purpureocillium lavendulum]